MAWADKPTNRYATPSLPATMWFDAAMIQSGSSVIKAHSLPPEDYHYPPASL